MKSIFSDLLCRYLTLYVPLDPPAVLCRCCVALMYRCCVEKASVQNSRFPIRPEVSPVATLTSATMQRIGNAMARKLGVGVFADAHKTGSAAPTRDAPEYCVFIRKIECSALRNVEILGHKNDPYVLLEFVGEKRCTNAIDSAGQAAVFDSLDIEFNVSRKELLEMKMTVQVIDQNVIRSDVLIGEAEVSLCDLVAGSTERPSTVVDREFSVTVHEKMGSSALAGLVVLHVRMTDSTSGYGMRRNLSTSDVSNMESPVAPVGGQGDGSHGTTETGRTSVVDLALRVEWLESKEHLSKRGKESHTLEDTPIYRFASSLPDTEMIW